jgi:serine/threonine protein kinase
VRPQDTGTATQIGVAADYSHPALLMPRFPSSLEDLPQLNEKLLLRGGLRLKMALDFMHSKGLVHADIKSSNCMVKETGDWYLSDFGSSLKIGEKITSCTEMFSPEPIMFQMAKPRHDWMLLLVLLSVELDKGNLSGLIVTQGNIERIDKKLLLARCKTATNPEFAQLLLELQDMVWPNANTGGSV